MTNQQKCNHSIINYPEPYYDHNENVWVTPERTTVQTYHDLSWGAFYCTQCLEVKYYTGLWKNYYENGVHCSGSDGVTRDLTPLIDAHQRSIGAKRPAIKKTDYEFYTLESYICWMYGIVFKDKLHADTPEKVGEAFKLIEEGKYTLTREQFTPILGALEFLRSSMDYSGCIFHDYYNENKSYTDIEHDPIPEFVDTYVKEYLEHITEKESKT